MKYFNKLIDKIDDIEDNFNIINSRIIEFGKSTDYEHIDFGLVNKYNQLLVSYLDFLERQKKILLNQIDDNSEIEFQSVKELIDKRINVLIDNINKIKIKVQKIVDIKKQNLTENEIKEEFKSSLEMEKLKKLLKEFKKDLKFYKDLQKQLGIFIDLDDNIEKEIEKLDNNEEVILKQLEYIEDYTDILDNILKEKSNKITELKQIKEKLFKTIIKRDVYNNDVKKIFKDRYIVGLDILESDLNKDYKKFIEYNEKIDLFLNIGKFCKNFDLALDKSNRYGLDEILSPFKNIRDLLDRKILNTENIDLEYLLNNLKKDIGLGNLKNIIRFLNGYLDLLNTYNDLETINYKRVDSYYNIGFLALFTDSVSLHKLINIIVNNSKSKILGKFREDNVRVDKFNIFLIFINREYEKLNKLYDTLVYLNKKVLLINYSTLLTTRKIEIKQKLEFYKGEQLYPDLISFYIQVSKNKYKLARQSGGGDSYGGYSSGGYSSGGGGWSSSSSSGSSSYSSSGSSSW